jgi:hypothetical protein
LCFQVGKFDGRFNASLGSKLMDTSMLELISDSLCLVLASLLLAAHMASCFPRLWIENVQNFLEKEKVCKHLASMLRDDSFHVANEVYLCIIPLLTTKG